jgi:hypothetical protein
LICVRAFRLLVVLLAVFTLASIPPARLSLAGLSLPSVQFTAALSQTCNVRGATGGCSEYWVPAGPAEDTLVTTIFTDATAEFTNIQSSSPTIDLTDQPLTPDLTGPFTTSSNFLISQSVPSGFDQIEFNLGNNFWGCNFGFGNAVSQSQTGGAYSSTCGQDIRQGIAHMIDRASFARNEPEIAGQAVAVDNPEPSSNDGGLLSPNPCAWDSTFPESGSQCVVGAAGGTAYSLSSPDGGPSGYVWLHAPGSADLNAAAQHFVNAGIATGFNPSTSVLNGISSFAQQSGYVPAFYIRNDNVPLLRLGDSLAAEICYLFTGSYTVPCTYLTVQHTAITGFTGYQTGTSVNVTWWMYTAGVGSQLWFDSELNPVPSSRDPFDSTLYFMYNSKFSAGGGPWDMPPCSAQFSFMPANYLYLCNSSYDSLSSQMEYAPCFSAAGDPVAGQTTNSPGGDCPNMTELSMISAGIQAEDLFGQGAYSIPVFSRQNQYGYLNNGWARVINDSDGGIANYFTWLDTHNANPALAGTIRQGYSQSTSSLSPYGISTSWDFSVLGDIYDALAVTDPLNDQQLVDWMALSVQQLSNPSLTYTPPGGACTAPNTPVGCTASTFRFTLRSDMFFQDGRKVTSFDVAFSYLSLKAVGNLQSLGADPMTGITILGPNQFDINVNQVGRFTLSYLTALTILPGAYWTNAGSSAWANGIATCSAIGATCYPTQYVDSIPSGPFIGQSTIPSVNCTLGSCCERGCNFPASLMDVSPGKVSSFFDPITNHDLVGSGAWTCGVITNGGSSTSCSSSGAVNPPVGGSYILSRFGNGLAPASSVSGIYFRSNGNLAAYLWSQDTGDITHDFLNFSVVASCFGAAVTSTGPCAHFQRGIGANGGPISVGLSQVAIVNRFVGLNWVAPFNWVSSPPMGIIPLPPVLYENTITLNPASVAGCGVSYPTGGYDC